MRKLYWGDEQSHVLIVQKLQSENVILGSSDTVLGLLAPLTERGFSLLNEIKVRKDKPYIILIESALKAERFVAARDLEKVAKLTQSCWPGPLTLIFKARPDLPAWLKSPDGTIALRVPKHEGLLAILAHFPGLFSTSANIAGEPIPTQISEVSPQILEQATVVVSDSVAHESIPSTILDCSGPTIKVVRQGAYPVSELELIRGIKFDK